jgi:hypothetical protein
MEIALVVLMVIGAFLLGIVIAWLAKGYVEDYIENAAYSEIPEGDVPYTPNEAPVGTDHTRLEQEYRGFYRFVKGGDPKLKGLKRESMFIQLLEGLSNEEAELLCLVKDGKLTSKYKRITKAVISEAFPSIEWGGRS